jgi:hypothetical protein
VLARRLLRGAPATTSPMRLRHNLDATILVSSAPAGPARDTVAHENHRVLDPGSHMARCALMAAVYRCLPPTGRSPEHQKGGIVQGYVARKGDRYYAVIYEGIDPLTGRERRRWHPAGTNQAVAEAQACRSRRSTTARVVAAAVAGAVVAVASLSSPQPAATRTTSATADRVRRVCR